MLPHVLPGEVCLCLFMGFEATPLAYTPVTVFSLRVLVPLTWSVLHSCVVSNASLFSPADAVLLSSTMVKFPCGRTCPRSNSWKSWLSAFRCPQCNPRLATKIVIASLRNESVSRCLVDVNLGAALQQPTRNVMPPAMLLTVVCHGLSMPSRYQSWFGKIVDLATTISVFGEMLSENLDDIPKPFSTW